MKRPTHRQKQQLIEDTLGLIRRHGWESFAGALEAACNRVALHEFLSQWIWEKRARIVNQARVTLSKKS